jgi:hypothetical protein
MSFFFSEPGIDLTFILGRKAADKPVWLNGALNSEDDSVARPNLT